MTAANQATPMAAMVNMTYRLLFMPRVGRLSEPVPYEGFGLFQSTAGWDPAPSDNPYVECLRPKCKWSFYFIINRLLIE